MRRLAIALQELPEDIILLIFSLCDIYAVISTSQTNRYLHRIALDRTVWVALVEDLRLRGFIDRISAADIQASSIETLIGLVKTMVTGQDSWPAEKERVPTDSLAKLPAWLLRRTMSRISRSSRPKAVLQLTERVVVQPAIIHASAFPFWPRSILVLRGGKHILFQGRMFDSVHCGAVGTDAWLWSHQASTPASTVSSVGAEVVNDGKNATVVVCFKNQSINVVDIVDLDLETGISQTLLTFRLVEACPYSGSSVCGDIVVLRSSGKEYLLVNWRMKLCCTVVARAMNSTLSLKLIPDYMILAELARGSQLIARVTTCAAAALSSHWHRFEDDPTITSKGVVETSSLPTISSFAFHLPRNSSPEHTQLQMVLHESPLQSGLYRLWVYTSWWSGACTVRRSYHVERGALALRHKSVSHDTPDGHLWYSGHQIARWYITGEHNLLPPGAGFGCRVPLGAALYILDVSPYGGAIVYGTRSDDLVIHYLK
ncbi:hypothetical protein C8R44DRAFT_805981 [Mycena epipterygia]|nr:hypothetical protein C8R44DRAFT_805981 [Mycena epipterygia]